MPVLHQPAADINQKYQFLAKIGSGGMGDVFLAIQRGAVDFSRLVVIKRIHDYQGQAYSEERTKMFLNEASVVASLNHPHIVKIYDFCMTGPFVCIVMEYVEGETLKHVFKSCKKFGRRIPVGLACRLILDACDALRYAHNSTSPTGESLQVIHRDIGLHNLMLDSNGYLKIIDFGIAKSNFQSDLTSPDLVKGNPGYMAPDVFTETTPDHRIDIYALGLCLYELLTHTRAFKFEKTVTLGQIIHEINDRELPPPSKIVSDLPDGIDLVVSKSIAKNREERYKTAEEFARELEAVSRPILMTGSEVGQWFTENFASRLKERREFGAKILEHAPKNDPFKDAPNSIPDNLPLSPLNLTSIAPTPAALGGRSDVLPSPKSLNTFGLYKLLSVVFLLFSVCAVIVYFLFVGESSRSEETAVDNLIIACDPPDAMLSIDGKELGLIGSEGIALHVEPGKEHEIVLSKDGFRKYTLPFIGPVSGSKHVNAALIKREEKPIATETPPAKEASLAEEESRTSLSITDDRADTELSQPQERKKRERKRKRHASGISETSGGLGGKSSRTEGKFSLGQEENRKIPLPDDDERKVPLVDETSDSIRLDQ